MIEARVSVTSRQETNEHTVIVHTHTDTLTRTLCRQSRKERREMSRKEITMLFLLYFVEFLAMMRERESNG